MFLKRNKDIEIRSVLNSPTENEGEIFLEVNISLYTLFLRLANVVINSVTSNLCNSLYVVYNVIFSKKASIYVYLINVYSDR